MDVNVFSSIWAKIMRFRDLALVDTAGAKSSNPIIFMKKKVDVFSSICAQIMRFRDLALVVSFWNLILDETGL